MRRTTTILVSTAFVAALGGPALADPPSEHPGCEGILRALEEASPRGAAALQTVADGARVDTGDAGGFYWSEDVVGSVDTIVLVSFTDERVVVDAVSGSVSQNALVDRTGIEHVTFCG